MNIRGEKPAPLLRNTVVDFVAVHPQDAVIVED
jgi:hypothetical protein